MGKAMKRMGWFLSLVFRERPWVGGTLWPREAWELACVFGGSE